MAKLFDVIDQKFFSLLSAPNKELYLDCILEIYQRVNELDSTQENTKDNIVNNVEYLLDSRGEVVIDEADNECLTDTRNKARYIVNLIKECGWIYEEDLEHNVVLINFNANATKVIRLLQEISASTQLEYTGYIASIYLVTRELAVSKEISHIEQMYKQTDELIVSLKSLKSIIFNYYNNIISSAEFVNAQQILDELINCYKKDFFDKAYLNLKTYDNLSKYKDSIQKTVKSVRINPSLMEELTQKRIDDKLYPTAEAAEKYITEKLDYVFDSFNTIDNLIRTIDEKNQKYIHAAISKAMFFINRSDDFDGIFNRMMTFINAEKMEYGRDYRFQLFNCKNLDKMSLFTARETNRKKIEPDKICVEEVDSEFAAERMREIMRSAQYSFDEIGNYVQGLLKNRTRIRASEMPNATNEEFVKIILLFLYSKSYGCKYKLTYTNDKVTVNGISFYDFFIYRGEA